MFARDVKKYKCVGISAAVCGLITLAILSVFLFQFVSGEKKVMGPKLMIDHDGGADDAMAIFMALLYEEYFHGPEVIGLTTVHGNVNETQAFINSQRILNIAKRKDVPIYRGSTSAFVKDFPTDAYFGHDGLGDLDHVSYDAIKAQPETAALALIELSKEYEGNLTLLAIGSLTNVALAIKLDPDFIHRLNQLFVAAGNIYSENHSDAEFNALMDVEAYQLVVKNSVPEKVTVIPFSQIKDSLNETTKEWRQNVLGLINTDIMKALNEFERLTISKKGLWYLLDPAAMAIVLQDDLVTDTLTSENGIILCGEERGINTNNFTSPVTSNVRVINAIDQELYQVFLIDVFSAELNKA